MKKWLSFASLVLALTVSGPVVSDDNVKFPHRAKFKNVQTMELEELHKQLGSVNIVDVRSRFEYETLHIQGAMHIALSKEKLPAAVRELRARSSQPIVFYCNGTTCKKSYEAAELAGNAGIQNIYAYDAGLDAWSSRYPEQSVLLGKNPVQAAELISKNVFKARLLSAQDFEARVEKGAVVLDIRDLRQRDTVLYPMRELRAPLDDAQKIATAVSEAKRQNKTLLVYDKVGKQTRWFQYYLEKQGIKDYYFLDGGSEAYYDNKFGKPKFTIPEQG